MMSIMLLDPRSTVVKTERKQEVKLGDLKGKRVGYIFNTHKSAMGFWKTLEQEIGDKLKPIGTHRIYKENTWAPAPKAEIDKLMEETDYALIGVGA
jgi:hypothetical protein